MRGGTILPIMQHPNCYSVLECIDNPITLEIYLDSNGNAYGFLYLDDGESLKAEGARVYFWFENNTLSSSYDWGSSTK
mgnify:CR=1 FL=1